MDQLLMLFPIVIFLALLGCIEVGRRLSARRRGLEEPGEAQAGVGVMENAVFALFGLLLAFSFSGAAGRFDWRRQQILDEANALGTLWLRLELLPPESRQTVQGLVRAYTDARLACYVQGTDRDAATLLVTRLQGPLWSATLEACLAAKDTSTQTLVLVALNEVLDAGTTRVAATKVHPPLVIFFVLYSLALGCALQAGWRLGQGKQRHRAQVFGFSAAVALTLGITTDLELPRYGFIRIDDTDELLLDTRAGMR